MNKRELKKYRSLLEQKREAIVSSTGKKTHWDNMENTRHGDFVDQASDDNEVHVNIRLLQTDAKLLRAIEAAIAREKEWVAQVLEGIATAACQAKSKLEEASIGVVTADLPWLVFVLKTR